MGKRLRRYRQELIQETELSFDEWLQFIRSDLDRVRWNCTARERLERLTTFFDSPERMVAT
ncbi:MAG TPA: hypothetical protein V6D08_18270 [Candidatus Obscuribacterales bacterium]